MLYQLYFSSVSFQSNQKILMNECREALISSTNNNTNNNNNKVGPMLLHWLTAGQFAASIITYAPPMLFQGNTHCVLLLFVRYHRVFLCIFLCNVLMSWTCLYSSSYALVMFCIKRYCLLLSSIFFYFM